MGQRQCDCCPAAVFSIRASKSAKSRTQHKTSWHNNKTTPLSNNNTTTEQQKSNNNRATTTTEQQQQSNNTSITAQQQQQQHLSMTERVWSETTNRVATFLPLPPAPNPHTTTQQHIYHPTHTTQQHASHLYVGTIKFSTSFDSSYFPCFDPIRLMNGGSTSPFPFCWLIVGGSTFPFPSCWSTC